MVLGDVPVVGRDRAGESLLRIGEQLMEATRWSSPQKKQNK
jgi:hypothetical protein